ncbi:hypothetical protein EVB27_093 [Rhizobium phage RHph_TM16]|nr:hypothetical protein EVB27_093 [Rhizobium phage RHph_TM16]
MADPNFRGTVFTMRTADGRDHCDIEDKVRYNAAAVDREIRRSRKPISKREAKMIHALLKGRDK